MYEDTSYFDPSPDPTPIVAPFLGCPPETCSSNVNPGGAASLGFSMEDPAAVFRLDLEQSFHGQLMAEPSAAATDLLSLLRLPPASFPAEAPPGMLRDLFQTMPQNYGMFYGAEEREMGVGEDVFRDVDGGMFEDGVFEFRKDGRGKGKGSFPTEKQRRAQINEKYDILKLLVPNPTKADRASVVSDTIDYINELKRCSALLSLSLSLSTYSNPREKDTGIERKRGSYRLICSMNSPIRDGIWGGRKIE